MLYDAEVFGAMCDLTQSTAKKTLTASYTNTDAATKWMLVQRIFSLLLYAMLLRTNLKDVSCKVAA
jgi:hypothetical protein